MEKIDYEKLYKESLERAKKLHKDAIMLQLEQDIKDYEYIFPVLAESEDETIRKELIEHIKANCETGFLLFQKFSPDEIIAWLEKQGEQNHVDNVEPKFHEGDWVVHTSTGIVHQIKCPIENVTNKTYGYSLIDGGYISSVEEVNYHLWTIQDAKDGDVLQLGEVTAIFKKYIGNEHCTCYCSFSKAGGFEIPIAKEDNVYGCYDDTTPATKERRELLFQKMKEEGYEWDIDKKELMEIHNALEECEIENIEHGKYYYCIKDYFCGGRKQASKGDVVQALRGMSMMGLGVKANEYFIPVNSIKQNHAWSEEDEKRLKSCLNILQAKGLMGVTETINTKWLKSLKDRIKPHWKPSEEQMEVLTWCLPLFFDPKSKKILKSLIDDLKNNPYRD